jgi:hypothetical protein
MPVGGMLGHVDDSYQTVMGERPLSITKLTIPQEVTKFFALRSPMRWRANLMTGESVRQGRGRHAAGGVCEIMECPSAGD